jgi:outer membrane protein assembly factor BamB
MLTPAKRHVTPGRAFLFSLGLILLILLIGLPLAIWKFAPLIGKTPFRSTAAHVAERKTDDSAASVPFVAAEDWPAWRGPRGDGISREAGIAEPWPAEPLKEQWSADVGLGYSSPIAAGGRVYLFSLDNRHDALTCFDAATGHIIWSDQSDAGYVGDFPGTRATPAIDGNSIYTLGGEGELTRHDLATGRPVWRVNVLALTGASGPPGYGCGSSPLVALGKVFVQGGKGPTGAPTALALNQETGAVARQSEARGAAAYAHPILAQVPGPGGTVVPQLIIFGGASVFGMDPATGRTIWSQPWPSSYGVNSSTPVYSPADGRLFITSDYGMGCLMLRLSPEGAAKVWKNKEVKSKFQQTILDGGFLYANDQGRIKCLSWADGARKWEATADSVQIGENGSIVRVGDKLLLMSDTGTLSLLRATPDGFSVLSTSKPFDATEIWATPLLYGGRIYIKGTRELVCLKA